MLKRLGHEVYHYGVEGSDVECTEHVTVASAADRDATYPVDLTQQVRFDQTDEYHRRFYLRAIDEIKRRHEPRDFLLCAWGWGHKPIADAMPKDMLVVESGVGYEHVFAPYKVFESHAWMHWIYGKNGVQDGAFFDAVIPNFFDPSDFEYRERKSDYVLYLGRLIHRKGIGIVAEATKRAGMKLIIAGQGRLDDLGINEPHVEHIGFADRARRRELLAGACALAVPTSYIEPFAGVHAEAAFAGTPVVSTDWGVFGETVIHGVTGWRCRTLEQFVWALNHADQIRPADCRAWAENFTCDRVARMYDEYFQMLSSLWGDGWYAERPGRQDLDWLRRVHPRESLLTFSS